MKMKNKDTDWYFFFFFFDIIMPLGLRCKRLLNCYRKAWHYAGVCTIQCTLLVGPYSLVHYITLHYITFTYIGDEGP